MSQDSQRTAALAEIAREAGRIAQESRKILTRELKPDGSIVTNADRDVETWLRKELPNLQPGAGFWGEEFGFEQPGPKGLWVVDPVDGTSNFSYGSPLWGVSIALVKGNDSLLGAVFLPDLDELYMAEMGRGATLNEVPLPQIPPGQIQPYELVSYGDNIGRVFPAVCVPGKMRLSGSFVVEGAFVTVQRLRGLVGYRERLYDIAACLAIAKEVGAEIRYVDGEPFHIEEITQPVQIQQPWIIFPPHSEFYG